MAKNDNERLAIVETKLDNVIDILKKGFDDFKTEITNLKAKDTTNEEKINNLKSDYSLTKSDVIRMNAIVWVVVSAVLVLIISAFWGKLTGTQP